MEREMEVSKTAYFVTLTYAPETIPYNKYGHKTLCKDDLTKFFKRLRRNHERSGFVIENFTNNLRPTDKIRYYACGEYGEERDRPHYHAIIFNTSQKAIEKSWKLGQTHIVKANANTIGYVMKYLDKGAGKKKDWKRTPEFNTMSEGIGESYIEKNKRWHKLNLDILYVTTRKGIMIPMPRIYRLKIFTEDERIQQLLLVETKLEEIRQEQIKLLGETGYANKQSMLKKVDEINFRKKLKKRIID